MEPHPDKTGQRSFWARRVQCHRDVLIFAPVYFFLVGVEESGKVSAYVPYGGDRSVRVMPGIDQPMAGSLVLDDSPQTEYFVGLFSDEPLHFDDILAEVDAVRAEHETVDEGLEHLDLPGQHRWVVVRKEQP